MREKDSSSELNTDYAFQILTVVYYYYALWLYCWRYELERWFILRPDQLYTWCIKTKSKPQNKAFSFVYIAQSCDVKGHCVDSKKKKINAAKAIISNEQWWTTTAKQ